MTDETMPSVNIRTYVCGAKHGISNTVENMETDRGREATFSM